MIRTILVTGGAGYIGSHTVVQLIDAGYATVIYDNLSNCRISVIQRISQLTNKKIDFILGDIRDRISLKKVFKQYSIDAVIHFAGLKAVSESESNPLKYFDNNVSGSIALLEEMSLAGVETIVFSSSATVYGNPGYSQYKEDTPLTPVNVYGHTKKMVEDMLRQIKKAHPTWRIAILRYFNPVGAHPSGMLGEDPTGKPNNLMPYIAQVAIGKRNKLSIFGDDFSTPDGTGLRDYIHVQDLALGHVAALNKLKKQNGDLITVNLGTGQPHSVLEMVRAFENVSGRNVPFEITHRRKGDLAEYFADPGLAKKILDWEAKMGIHTMCEDTWRWQVKNPNGYPT